MAIDENVFTVVDRGGLNPFRIKVIPSSNNNSIGTLNVTTKGEQIIYQEHGETQNVLSIGLQS